MKLAAFRKIAVVESKTQACDDLADGLKKLKNTDYDSIDTLMQKIAKNYNITGKQLHNMWVNKYSMTPDDWIKKQNTQVEETEELDEVAMNPGTFQKWLKSGESEGIRAGFEAELIFRDTSHGDDNDEYEPDYDADERAYDIDSIVDFFRGGDNGMGRTQAERFRANLEEDFFDWINERMADDWDEVADEEVLQYMRENVWESERDDRILEKLEENDVEDPDTVVKIGEDVRQGKVKPTDLGEEDREKLVLYNDAEESADADFLDEVSEEISTRGSLFDEAYEQWSDNVRDDYESSDWLNDNGYRYMSDIENAYSVDWPYWRGGNSGGGGRDWNEIGNSLERVTGLNVKVSSGYHGARRGEWYVVEPDSSLDADDEEDYGLEIISPPLPLPEAIEQLKRVIDWANGEGDAYTNSSTGIHMGVSLPFKGGDVDPVKLILFMGDKYILEKFEREGNHYCRSAYDKLRNKISSMKNAGPKQIKSILELIQKNLIELAHRDLKVLGDKYVSVNPHDGYIEFRGPGNDYLAKESEIDGILENTMLRLAYAMNIAGRGDLYRKEYAKKLYKLVNPEGEGNPFMRLFADFSAGTLTSEELKTQWAETVLRAEQGEDEDVPMDIAKEYEVFDKDTNKIISTFRAYNDQEALEQTQRRWSDKGINFGVRRKAPEEKTKAVPSRRAELAKRVTRSTRDVGEQLWVVNYHSKIKRVVARSQAAAIEKAATIDKDFGRPEARARLADRQEIETYRIDQERERQRAIQARAGKPRPAGGEFTGQWQIKDTNGRVLHQFGGIGNSQYDANRFAAGWLARNGHGSGTEVEVVPVMEEDLDEGWKDQLANLGIAGALAVAGTGSLAAKKAVTDYFSEPNKPASTAPAPKQDIKTTPKAEPKKTMLAKNEPAKKVEVKSITGNPLEELLRRTAIKSGIRGVELAQFMAQCAHETLDFKRLVEIGGSLDFRKYDPKYASRKAKALGNKFKGDGARYKGRGYIQITGRYNYKRAGEELGLPLEKHPELVEKPAVAAKVAVWFWKHRVQPNVDNFYDTIDVTKQINPSLNGLGDRKSNFKEYMQVAMK